MRPRKLIYIYSAYPIEAAKWKYALQVRPAFRPVIFEHVQDLVDGFVRKCPEGLLVIANNTGHAMAVASLIDPVRCDVHGVFTVPGVPERDIWPSGHVWAQECHIDTIFELLHLTTARKRGPKKGSERKPPVRVSAAVAVEAMA